MVKRAAIVVAALCALAGCSSSGSDATATVTHPAGAPKDPKCVTEAKVIVTAVEAFNAQRGRYPVTVAELKNDGELKSTPRLFLIKGNGDDKPTLVLTDAGTIGGCTPNDAG